MGKKLVNADIFTKTMHLNHAVLAPIGQSLRFSRYPTMPAKLVNTVRRELLPLFDFIRNRATTYFVTDDDETEIAMHLTRYLWPRTAARRLIDTLPFFWSFYAVDVDIYTWHQRFPFEETVRAIMDEASETDLRTLHEGSIEPTLSRQLRITFLQRTIGVPNELELMTSDYHVNNKTRQLKKLWKARRHALMQGTWYVHCSFVFPMTAAFLWGGSRWIDVLCSAEG